MIVVTSPAEYQLVYTNIMLTSHPPTHLKVWNLLSVQLLWYLQIKPIETITIFFVLLVINKDLGWNIHLYPCALHFGWVPHCYILCIFTLHTAPNATLDHQITSRSALLMHTDKGKCMPHILMSSVRAFYYLQTSCDQLQWNMSQHVHIA